MQRFLLKTARVLSRDNSELFLGGELGGVGFI